MTEATLTATLSNYFATQAEVTYRRGERIIREHENPPYTYYISSGIVRMYLISDKGNEFTSLLVTSGSVFPLRPLTDRLSNIYNFNALTDVVLRRVLRDDCIQHLSKDPALYKALFTQLIDERSALIYRLQHVVFGNATAKIASALLVAGKQFDRETCDLSEGCSEVPLTHQQIADMMGVTRETASIELKKFELDGLIHYRNRTIVLTKVDSLRALAHL